MQTALLRRLSRTMSNSSSSSSAKLNRLHREKSPYLRQHETNPVDWYAWGEDAFAAARSANKPIFLSIGYSTCHWCHVMAHESFENEEIAKVMNENFVNIKVDREERPDIDRQYMFFVQMTTGSGGWPLSVFLTPQLKPFLGGTYFPPQDVMNRPGFKRLLELISQRWQMNQKSFEDASDKAIHTLSTLLQTVPAEKDPSFSFKPLLDCYSDLAASFDSMYGGFGGAPKFPTPPLLEFLAAYHTLKPLLTEDELTGNPSFYPAPSTTPGIQVIDHSTSIQKTCDNALEMLIFSLTKMADGGMYDHIGAGFHRYSVDKYFHVPHFEKMLYDQAQLMSIYAKVGKMAKIARFEDIAMEIFEYCERKLKPDVAGYMAAQDADSLPDGISVQKKEGAFYTWTEAEIRAILKNEEQADMFCWMYGVEPDGNVRSESDSHGELDGKNVLFRKHSIEEVSQRFSLQQSIAQSSIDDAMAKLDSEREKRPHPSTDYKIITAWNGLMLTGLCDLWKASDSLTVWNAAKNLAKFIQDEMYSTDHGLRRIWANGTASTSIPACAEDYAFAIQGFLSLYQITGDSEYILFAITLQAEMDGKFWDRENFGYMFNEDSEEAVLSIKDDHDGAEPAINSAALKNLIILHHVTANPLYHERVKQMFKLFWQKIESSPSQLPSMAVGVMSHIYPSLHFVISKGDQGNNDDERLYYELLGYISRRLGERQVLIVVDTEIAKINQTLKQSNLTSVSVCDDTKCFLQTSNISDLKRFFE